jgi:hypothetical protein
VLFLSQIIKAYYKNSNTTKEDIFNIHRILDIYAKMVLRLDEMNKVANLCEVAGYFDYLNIDFWNEV